MSVKNYRFVSPGVFVNEIDNSQLPASPAGIGPVIIGRAEKGPALRPITVNSFEEFVNVFGTPNPGNSGDDVWRQGANTTATTYGAYAAQAYLRNSSPLTFVRLLGVESDSPTGNSGDAGWAASENNSTGTAWGLVLFETSSNSTIISGALAAVVYGQDTTVLQLSGNILRDNSGTPTTTTLGVTGSDFVVQSLASGTKEFKLRVVDGSDIETITFNFNRNDSKYIRKVLNTNPQLVNSAISTNTKNYWLGETFDRHVKAIVPDANFAAVVRLNNGDTEGDDHKYEAAAARTPNIISCRLSPTDTPLDLFYFEALDQAGEWSNKNLKISIQDIKRSTNNESEYGSFSVVVRLLSDSDNVVQVIEQFNNCDLNPNSLNYVARKIGDSTRTWLESERRYQAEGNWANNSRLIRIVMNSDVDAGNANPSLLPFGFEGIVKYTDVISSDNKNPSWVSGSQQDFISGETFASNSAFILSGAAGGVTASVEFPRPVLRVSASDGNLLNPTDAYFGMQTSQGVSSTVFDTSTRDLLLPRGGAVGFTANPSDDEELSPTFTLDDIKTGGVYSTGSYNVDSLTFQNGAVSGVLDAGYDRFTVPLFGGFDGLNIKEMDPFSGGRMSSPTDTNNYAFYSIRRAIDSVADPEVVEMNLVSVPGQTQEGLTTHLVRTCEDRADALAVIDLPGAFTPREDSTAINRNNSASTITTLVNGLRDRGLNSSYGCAYYPWVRARDTINGAFLWLPPSVAAIGTFSSSQRRTQVWFAPAGFNRGGLTEGSAGIPVVDVAHQLRRKDRDDLYTANINPIAKFPAEGVVIFGQKTLQVTPSALDRINVRRLMIFVKKRISQIASGLLFDPNVQQTWKRFTAQVNPFLADVKTNFGLSDYRVVLDETTTTPDLVDRNILYAQIYLKPTRAIEFIAIDFNITRTGASFDD